MALIVDSTNLRIAAGKKVRYYDNCSVVDIGSGSFPREIVVQTPGDDGEQLIAVNNTLFGLTTSHEVRISVSGVNPVAIVEGFGTGTSGNVIDNFEVSKLVSPDGVTDPVLSADNNGDLTGVGGLALNGASIGNALTVDYDNTDTIPTTQGVDSAAALVLDNPNAAGVHTGIGFRVLSASTIIGLLAYEVDSAPDGDFVFRQRDGATSSKETLRLEGATGDAIVNQYANGDAFAFIVNNGSGAAASANEIGYIDENGDYQTTTTQFDDVDWVVVTRGGANGADIYVTRQGQVTIELNGNCSAGDKIYTSTTAGQGDPQTYVRPEMFAVALTANSGGAGGTCEALLYTNRGELVLSSSNNILFLDSSSDSNFVAVVASAGVSGDKVYHDPPSSGAVDAITPQGSSELGRLVLHNTTQGEEAFIVATGTDATDDFIQVSDSADISGWATSDSITVRSQTNTSVPAGGVLFFDVDMSDTSELPVLSTGLVFTVRRWDSGADGQKFWIHPWESNSNAKRIQVTNHDATPGTETDHVQTLPIIQKRICVASDASGSATAGYLLRLRGAVVATP